MLGESRLVYLVDFCLCTWSIIELVFSFEIARRVKSFTSRNFSYYERKSFPFHSSSVYAEVETNFVQKISAKKKQEWYRKRWRNTMLFCDEKCLTRNCVVHCWIRFWAIVVLIFPLKQIVSPSSSSSLSHSYVVRLSIFYVNNVSWFC